MSNVTHEFEFNSTLRPIRLRKMLLRGQRTVKALCGRQVPVDSTFYKTPFPTCSGCETTVGHLLALEVMAG